MRKFLLNSAYQVLPCSRIITKYKKTVLGILQRPLESTKPHEPALTDIGLGLCWHINSVKITSVISFPLNMSEFVCSRLKYRAQNNFTLQKTNPNSHSLRKACLFFCLFSFTKQPLLAPWNGIYLEHNCSKQNELFLLYL